MPFLTDVARNLRHVRFPKNAPAKVFRPQPQTVHPHVPMPRGYYTHTPMTRDYYGHQTPAPEWLHPTQAQAQAEQPSAWDKLLGKHKKKRKQQTPEPQVQVPNVRVRRGESGRRAD